MIRFSSTSFARAKSILLLAFLVIGLAGGSAVADDNEFTEDAAAGIKKAVEEEKEIILFFTGSDWCPPCKKLEEEVFSEKEFMFEVSKHYVLIKFDFPKRSEQDPKLKKQNDEFAKKFGIDSFPTLVLCDNKLKPFAFASYEQGGFQNYLGLLEEARKLRVNRDEKLAAAAKKVGPERAKLLDEAISEMREEIIKVYYTDVVDEIVKLDADNEMGLRKKWNEAEDVEMRKVIMEDLMMIARVEQPERAMEFIDEVEKEIEFSDAERLKIYQMKLNLVRQLNDDERTDALLDEMINLKGVEGDTKQRLIVKKIYLMVGTGRKADAMKVLEAAIAEGATSMHLYLAKGQLLSANNEHAEAIAAFDQALKTARSKPDVMIDLVSAKADSLFATDKAAEALQALDNFAEDTQMPSDLRGEALLHKGMIMRDMKRLRQARLAENRAIEITESPKERAEMQKIVERLRKKYSQN